MKNLFKIFTLAIILSGFAVITSAQPLGGVTLYPSASAVIVTTLELTQMQPLHFGDLASSSQNAGYVILEPDATPTRTGYDGISLPASVGTPMAARFYVEGAADQAFVVTIPQVPIVITRVGFTDFMTVDDFTCDLPVLVAPDTWVGVLSDPNGDAYFYVGATCTAIAGMPAGLYTNLTGFPVNVNYQ